MFDNFISQLLIISLLFFSCIRIFTVKTAKIDSFVIFAPVALIISILNILTFGLTLINLGVFLLALLIFFTNVRSLFRISAKLVVDTYSPLFLIFTIFELVLLIVTGIFIILYRPVKVNPDKFDSTKQILRYTGSCSTGFSQILPDTFNRRTTAWINLYKPKQVENSTGQVKPVVLINPGPKAGAVDYEPFIYFLSQKGYEVLAGEFYSNDAGFAPSFWNSKILRKFYSLYINKKVVQNEKQIKIQTGKALSEIAVSLYGKDRKFFIVSDGMDFDSVYEIIGSTGGQTLGFFSLNSVSEYKSSPLGFVEQTNILLAKQFALTRDKTFFIPRYAAGKCMEQIRAITDSLNVMEDAAY